MPAVTALREQRDGRVAVDLDGVRWRVVAGDAVVRAGLRVGADLDRTTARRLRRELRRSDALAAAARALARRDLSRHELESRLDRSGVAAEAREEAVRALARTGAVDDRRVAHARAAALAERGHGNAAIRWDLERRGLTADVVEDAVGALAPERERVARIVARRGSGPTVLRLLARRGFAQEAIESACAGSGRIDG